MIPRLRNYARIAGREAIDRIMEEAEPLRDRHITHINSTSAGGGVSEILNTMVLLFNDVGIKTGWRLLKGTHTLFTITKKIHNAMQGDSIRLGSDAKEIYLEEAERNYIMNHLQDHDLVVVHDPQPLAMIKYYQKRQPWIWRCHIDIKHRNPDVWAFLSTFIKRYDAMIVTLEKYMQRDIGIPQHIVPVSIDPLSLKNKALSTRQCRRLLSSNGIDPDRPIICQVSRFDKWKNPLGVVKIFEKVRKEHDCQLVLIGDMATDDPEGTVIYNSLIKRVVCNGNGGDIHVMAKRADLLVNALQRHSHVVLQNSIREGFGLTVAEALYKETPVVAMDRGGISLQVKNGRTGYLINGTDEAAKRTLKLLRDSKLRERMGRAGREHVIRNFLVTRHMLDYLRIFKSYLYH